MNYPKKKRPPPHICGVSIRMKFLGGINKAYCHLRRADNDEWLWSSKPYVHPQLAVRDAVNTAKRFGWKVTQESLKEAKDGVFHTRLEINDPKDFSDGAEVLRDLAQELCLWS